MNRAVRSVAWILLAGLLSGAAGPALADPLLILNEFNSVKGSQLLKNSNADSHFGRVEGNGDNWIELVVVADHADIRGWELRWLEDDGDGNGTSVWDPTRVSGHQSQGKIVFGNAAVWADLRAGTILTISDKQTVDTEYENGNPAHFDLSTDTSFNPATDDWWIHVSSRQEAGQANPLVRTANNVTDDPPGAFSVGNDDWELRILDGTATVFGPIGEEVADWGGGGISGDEIGKLEVDPSGSVTAAGFRDGSSSTFGAENLYDGGTRRQDLTALRAVVPEPSTLAIVAGIAVMSLIYRRRRRT